WITLDQGIQFVLTSMNIMGGGEIFVPKIPSMKITDIAQAMAPQAKLKIVGIRPGEKLHEVMVPYDDARQTFDIQDRYVIQPQFPLWSSGEELQTAYKNYVDNMQPVSEEFSYSSDTNEEWLSIDQLNAILTKK
nr:polysaccharide biosynthesis protein [Alphaproteobacteria bacterium]